jgi:NAD(P)-dependent dehydrogenase (short-subunit alcohol dehydrogenase family)
VTGPAFAEALSPDRFKGRVAVVTGGAEGIGRAVGRRIAREGGRVALFDLNTEQMERTQAEFAKEQLRVLAIKCDVTSEVSVQAAIERLVNAAKRLDILVHCAGAPGPTNTKITEYSAGDFRRIVELNLVGSFLVAKYAIPAMLANGYGRLLLLASIAGKDGNPGMCGYTASKAGVIGLVKGLGKEFAETGVTVNGLAPAVIQTRLLESVKPEQIAYMTDRIPMRRVGTPDEVAAVAAWIVSSESSFTTGFIFDATGGRAVY